MKSKNNSNIENEKNREEVIVDRFKMWRIIILGGILFALLLWRLCQMSLEDETMNFGLITIIAGVIFIVVLTLLTYKYAVSPKNMSILEKIKISNMPLFNLLSKELRGCFAVTTTVLVYVGVAVGIIYLGYSIEHWFWSTVIMTIGWAMLCIPFAKFFRKNN